MTYKIPVSHLLLTRLEHFIGDVVAGLTVGLTVLPQSIAFAKLAGLPQQASINVSKRIISFSFHFYDN